MRLLLSILNQPGRYSMLVNFCHFPRILAINSRHTISSNMARSSASKDVRAGFLFVGPDVNL